LRLILHLLRYLKRMGMDINSLTAARVKAFRLRLNYSAEAVAKALAINKANYSRLENGKTEITLRKLERLAQLFNVPVYVLIHHKNSGQNMLIERDVQSNGSDNEIMSRIDPFLAQTIEETIDALQRIRNTVKS
jgi:transcriptional regulator with XRE-family HTH domain